MSSFVPSPITQPFFELQTPDFAWNFVWIVQINYKSTKVQKVQEKYISTKVLITQSFLELETPDFAWKFVWTAHRHTCKINFRDSLKNSQTWEKQGNGHNLSNF